MVSGMKELYQARKFDPDQRLSLLAKDGQGNFTTTQEKSDVVHDLLAFLAEQMPEINKQKQQEFKCFLGWLETEMGSKVEDLSLKMKVKY